MRYVAPVLILIGLLEFTAPSGRAVFVAPSQITAIGDAAGCSYEKGARLLTSAGFLCVRESVEEVVKRFSDEAKK